MLFNTNPKKLFNDVANHAIRRDPYNFGQVSRKVCSLGLALQLPDSIRWMILQKRQKKENEKGYQSLVLSFF